MNDNQPAAAQITDEELSELIAKYEAADDLGNLLCLQDELDDKERRKLVLHAIWRLYARTPRTVRRKS